jgi:hypothetical protein
VIFTRKKEWAKVENLFPEQIATLTELGYPTYQMRSIFEDVLRGRLLSQLTQEDVVYISNELDKYIEFAKQCHSSIRT